MAKSGRPRKSGERHRCGKRTRLARQEEITATVKEGRMRTLGISKELAGSHLMGSPLGRLVHWRIISQAQADAGYDFAMVMREYLASAKLQRPTAGSASLEAKSPSSDSELTVRGETKARAYMDALAEIDRQDWNYRRSGLTVTSMVWHVCIDEQDVHGDPALGALRVGLNAIHRILYGRKAA